MTPVPLLSDISLWFIAIRVLTTVSWLIAVAVSVTLSLLINSRNIRDHSLVVNWYLIMIHGR